MPIRTSSVKKKIAANGLALHRAKEGGRAEAEAALMEERKALKEERKTRKAQALVPRPSALDRLVRTQKSVAKATTKPKSEARSAEETKKPKAGKSRAQKQAQKAAAVEAERKPKKPAK